MVFGKKKKEDKVQVEQDKEKINELLNEEPKQPENDQGEQKIDLSKLSSYDVHIYNLMVLMTKEIQEQTEILKKILATQEQEA